MSSLIIDNLERMLAAGQDNPTLRFGLGKAYLTRKAFQNAVEHLEQAVSQDPDYSAAWKLLGRAYMQAEMPEAASRTFAQGIQVAERKGDVQAVREMKVFLKRLEKGAERE